MWYHVMSDLIQKLFETAFLISYSVVFLNDDLDMNGYD